MRRIAVEIDAGDKHCCRCEHRDYSVLKDNSYCDMFVTINEPNYKQKLDVDKNDCLRCDQCLAAEIKGDE